MKYLQLGMSNIKNGTKCSFVLFGNLTLAEMESRLQISLCLLLLAGGAWTIELPERSDAEPLKWWQEEVVYQVYPRSHQDTDGDGTGDLAGIERRLDHFVDLGVGSVWISPIYESPMVDFGYDISNFTDIDPIFGTMEDFRSLSRAMKDRGIKLIMDFVPNHSSDQHEWFQKSIAREDPYADYYVWQDAKQDADGNIIPPNNWLSVFGGSAWTWNPTRGQYYLHQFTKEQPDLNFNNRAVILQMRAVLQFWLEKGVDGFRMDAVPHMFEDPSFEDEPVMTPPPPGAQCTPLRDYACLDHTKTYNLPQVLDVLAEFRQHIDTFSANDGHVRVMMVEATIPTLDDLFEYYGNSTRPIAHYPFNFEFINRIRGDFDGNDVADLVNEWYTKMPEGNTANWLLGNHDNHRVGTRFGPELVDALNMINLLLPGSAVTYYGEEIGMTDAFISWEDTVDPPGRNAGEERYQEFSRDPERTPMQWDRSDNAGFSTVRAPGKTWLPVHPDYLTVNVEDQRASENMTHLQAYKRIVELRKTDAWRYGSMESHSIDNGNLFGFTRIYQDEGFVMVVNFGSTLKLVNLQDHFQEVPIEAYAYQTSVGYVPPVELDELRRTDAVAINPNHAIIFHWVYQLSTPEEPEDPTTSIPSTPSGGPSQGTGSTGPSQGTGSTGPSQGTGSTGPSQGTGSPGPSQGTESTEPSQGTASTDPSGGPSGGPGPSEGTSTEPGTVTDGAPKSSFNLAMVMLAIFSVLFSVLH